MQDTSTKPTSNIRKILAAVGMAIGGCAPLITGIVGIWGYATKGYFIAKTGERVDGPIGFIVCTLFILAGLWMIAYAIRLYCRRS